MSKRYYAFFLVLLIGISGAHAAGIQKWVDDNGKVHYGERPPAKQKSEEVTTTISVVGANVVSSPSVVLYTTSWCGYCKKARRYLNENNIAYREYDIEKDEIANRRYERAGGQGVPLLVRGNDSLQGFRKSSYDRFFNAR